MRVLRSLLLGLVGLVVLVGIVAVMARYHDGPIGPFPGGKLTGTRAPDAAPDWPAALNRAGTLEIEVNPAHPRSVTTSYVVRDRMLYVPSMMAARKTWPHEVLADDRVVLRIAGKLYDRRAVRVTDRDELRGVVRAFDAKNADEPDLGHLSTWYFRMDPPRT